MKIFKECILASLMAFTILIIPGVAAPQNSRGCAWPIELASEGFGNATIDRGGCNFDLVLPNIPTSDDLEPAGQCAQRAMGDYYPVAVWCDKPTFVHGGWQACINGR